MHILLVDDNHSAALPVIAFLREKGYKVSYVQDGRIAVEAFQTEPPDLVLMDVVMPEMDGIEATRRIKALAGSRWIPIILMTALSAKEDIVSGLDAGADDYLVKPIDFEILAARLRSMKRIAIMQDSLSGILDNVYEAILTIDEKGIVQSFNKSAERIFGHSPAEIIGANVKLLMPSPYTDEHDGYLSRYLQERSPRVIGIGRKVKGLRKNGETFPIRLSVTEIRRPVGSHFIGMVSDISDEEVAREQAEVELAFQSDEKGKRAAELVIANEELAFQNDEKEKRAAELVIANKELAFQSNEKGKRAAEFQELEKLNTESNKVEKEVRKLAFHDSLTSLPNRRLLNDRLTQAMATSKRSGCHGALLFLDLDNFKPLNDKHGHAVGDLLLIEAAHRLKSCVREMDTVARFGGDEFVVILSELDVDKNDSKNQARIVAEKIHTTLSEPYFLTISQEGKSDTTVEHQCTASIGVALFINHEASQDNVLSWADKAMYLAKEAGRNSIQFYDAKE